MMDEAIGPIALQAEIRDGRSPSSVRDAVKPSSEGSGANFTFEGSSKIAVARQRSMSKPDREGATP